MLDRNSDWVSSRVKVKFICNLCFLEERVLKGEKVIFKLNFINSIICEW